MDRIETVSRNTAVWGGLVTALGQSLTWIGENAALCGVMIAFCGLGVQLIVAQYNKNKAVAERQAIESSEKRRQEEHELKMAILRAQLEAARDES